MAAIAQMEGNADFAGLYWTQTRTMGRVSQGQGIRSGEPALHRRLRRAPGAQRQSERQGDLRPGRVRQAVRVARRQGEGGRVRQARQGVRRALGEGSRRRRSFPAGVRSARHVEPEVQPGLGPHPRPEPVPRRGAAQGNGLLPAAQNAYGLPLDNRQDYTKLDWILWTATLTQDRAGFRVAGRPGVRFLNETPDRSPMTDWYLTTDARKTVGFTARPGRGRRVPADALRPGGLDEVRRARQDQGRRLAPMPKPPRTVTLLPTSQTEPALWRYTTERPAGNWQAADFDDSAWQEGPGGFGTPKTPGAVVRTQWNSGEIWLRRSFELAAPLPPRAALRLHHDEDASVYLNGVSCSRAADITTDYEAEEIDVKALRTGRNVLAIHCRQTTGGQYIDAGLEPSCQETSSFQFIRAGFAIRAGGPEARMAKPGAEKKRCFHSRKTRNRAS